MNNDYINLYNNLVKLTRNKILYEGFTKQDTYSDRLIIFLFHFAFFLNIFKKQPSKTELQNIFDYNFRQIELTIREMGYGDTAINKRMKNCVNIFFSILKEIENWEKFNQDQKKEIFYKYLNIKKNTTKLTTYFDNYRNYLKKNTFNSLIKGVFKLKF